MPTIKVGPAIDQIRTELMNAAAEAQLKNQARSTPNLGAAAQSLGGNGVHLSQEVRLSWQLFSEQMIAADDPRELRRIYNDFRTREGLSDV